MSDNSNREYSEQIITKRIMKYFYNIADNAESFIENGNEIRFDFSVSKTKFRCQTNKGLSYNLPNDCMEAHNADIVITRNEGIGDSYALNPSGRFVSIEIKHKSAVTDAFKSRAFDMIHLRQEYPLCFGVMMYIRERNLTIEKAKEYCYPYQKFFGCTTEELTEEKIRPLFGEIVVYLNG